MTPDTTKDRPARADAQRNRAHILATAEAHFVEHGVSGSLDAIAREAGVGAGTLYRHFPTREALLAALLEAREQDLSEQIEAIRAEVDDPAIALARWLAALQRWTTAFQGLPEPLRGALEASTSPLAPLCAKYLAITEQFLGAAQRSGSARPDVRVGDVFLAVLAISWVSAVPLADESTPEALHDLLRNGWATPTG